MTATYLALDLETTGLDPTKDRILEVGVIVVDSDFNSLGEWETVVQAPAQCLDGLSEFVRDMHLTSGLLQENGVLASVGMSLADAEEYLVKIATAFPDKPILLGSSVHFDRGFLRHWMPAFEALLRRRHMDASALALAGIGTAVEHPGPEHRALPDARHSLARVRAGVVR